MSRKFNAGKIKKNDIYQVLKCIKRWVNILNDDYQSFTHDIFHFVLKIKYYSNRFSMMLSTMLNRCKG
jgi:hypothetical protein